MTLPKVCSSTSWVILLSALVGLSSATVAQGKVSPRPQIEVKVTNTEQTKYGYLLTVEIINNSARTLYFPQSSYWIANHSEPPQINSLGVQQWSDGITNILPGGRTIDSTGQMEPGFFSVGPCHDDPWTGKWIVLQSGKSFEDRIMAFEPPTGYITVMCRWRSAHLGGKARIVLSGYLSRTARKWIDFHSEPFQLPKFNQN
jgi:hypothetical protein